MRDCKETDGSFNSIHGHVAPPFMRLLLLERYHFISSFGEGRKLNRLISTHSKLPGTIKKIRKSVSSELKSMA